MCIVYTTKWFLEVAIDSCTEQNFNPWPLNSMYNSFIELRGTVEHTTRLQFDPGGSVVRLSTKTFNDVFKILNKFKLCTNAIVF